MRGVRRRVTADRLKLLASTMIVLAGCEARFTADLGTDAPADADIAAVEANLLGLEFRRADGSTRTLEFRDPEIVELRELERGEPLRLFTDEQLPAGDYTGVRLLFDEDQDEARVETTSGDLPLSVQTGTFVAVDFSVVDDEDSSEALTLMLDLRQSLRLDDDDAGYTLTPKLRAVPTLEAARVEGDIAFACATGTTPARGEAVYLFEGSNVEPDDLDGLGAEPFATTRVDSLAVAGPHYALRFLPAGAYTVAFTCDGEEDDPGVSDDVRFRGAEDFRVDDREVLERDLE